MASSDLSANNTVSMATETTSAFELISRELHSTHAQGGRWPEELHSKSFGLSQDVADVDPVRALSESMSERSKRAILIVPSPVFDSSKLFFTIVKAPSPVLNNQKLSGNETNSTERTFSRRSQLAGHKIDPASPAILQAADT